MNPAGVPARSQQIGIFICSNGNLSYVSIIYDVVHSITTHPPFPAYDGLIISKSSFLDKVCNAYSFEKLINDDSNIHSLEYASGSNWGL
mgnify:CR=1 FL=1